MEHGRGGVTLQTAVDTLAETFPWGQNRNGRSISHSTDNSLKPYPVDTSVALAGLLERFEGDQQPAPISFRKLVPWLKVGERASHYLHPYPSSGMKECSCIEPGERVPSKS